MPLEAWVDKPCGRVGEQAEAAERTLALEARCDVVGETNDAYLSDMWLDPVRPAHVQQALAAASGGPVAEGSVGAGAGTSALGFKGGIGTSSRRIPAALGGYTVGVLVQSNFGGILVVRRQQLG